MKVSKKAAKHILTAMMYHATFKEKLASGTRGIDGEFDYPVWERLRDDHLRAAGLPTYTDLEKMEKGA